MLAPKRRQTIRRMNLEQEQKNTRRRLERQAVELLRKTVKHEDEWDATSSPDDYTHEAERILAEARQLLADYDAAKAA